MQQQQQQQHGELLQTAQPQKVKINNNKDCEDVREIVKPDEMSAGGAAISEHNNCKDLNAIAGNSVVGMRQIAVEKEEEEEKVAEDGHSDSELRTDLNEKNSGDEEEVLEEEEKPFLQLSANHKVHNSSSPSKSSSMSSRPPKKFYYSDPENLHEDQTSSSLKSGKYMVIETKELQGTKDREKMKEKRRFSLRFLDSIGIGVGNSNSPPIPYITSPSPTWEREEDKESLAGVSTSDLSSTKKPGRRKDATMNRLTVPSTTDGNNSNGNSSNNSNGELACYGRGGTAVRPVIDMLRPQQTPRALILDVGGRRHKVMETNFNLFPNTRLGKLVRARTAEEILKLCDGYTEGDDDNTTEFFFDRNWHSFNSILDIYRTGVLHLNTDMCALVLQKDLDYWQIDELILEPCCALKYYPEIEICVKEQQGEQESKRKEAQRLEDENFGRHCLGRVRTFLWNLMEYPETSKYAQVMAFTSLGVVLISTMTFVLGTFPEFQPEEESGVPEQYPEAVIVMRVIDNIAVGFFLIEYVIRLACAPRKLQFFVEPMNLVDMFAILPFFMDLIIGGLQDFEIMGKAGKIVRLVRVMRIMRIFKLVRHFAGLQSLIYTLNQAYKELGLLMLLVGVAVLTFSSLVYFAEKDNPKGAWSFLDSFWWGLMTLTTVGYGDLSPSTFPGKLIGGMCALGGIFILTLPIPIVVNSFASYYKNRLWRNEVAYKKRQRAKKRKEMELLMRDNLLNILTVPGTPIQCDHRGDFHLQ